VKAIFQDPFPGHCRPFLATFGHLWRLFIRAFLGHFKIAGKPDVSLVGAGNYPILVSVVFNVSH
jgi:hypothetical protein